MAIIYGKAISIGYTSSKPSGGGGGLYSIWLTIPSVATSVTFTAVKGDVSVPSTYISTIGAAKITLPETDYEGDWTVSGTVGGKTASQTVTVTSDKNDYFVDMRNDFIPLSGELKVGNLVTFDDKSWRVVHQEGTHYYLASDNIVSQTIFGSNNKYAGSTVASVAATYESEQLSDTAKEYCIDVTVEDVTAKVFIPTYDQCNGGFEYYSSDANRIANYNGSALSWWTSTSHSSNNIVYHVNSTGKVTNVGIDFNYGFRPHICIDFGNGYNVGFDFTYSGKYYSRSDGVLELLTSGVFQCNDTKNIDVFMVGGGGKGSGTPSTGTHGGGGGGGGQARTIYSIPVTSDQQINVIIGDGATEQSSTSNATVQGGSTSFGSYIAKGGYSAHKSSGNSTSSLELSVMPGASGGSGGGGGTSAYAAGGNGGADGNDGGDGTKSSSASGSIDGGDGQMATTREFGESTGKLYAGGGGAGKVEYKTDITTTPLGGEGGGGSGAGKSNNTISATSGEANTGGGGGGSAYTNSSGISGRNGGSGIVCIRVATGEKTEMLNGTYTFNSMITKPTFKGQIVDAYRSDSTDYPIWSIGIHDNNLGIFFGCVIGTTKPGITDLYSFDTNTYLTTGSNYKTYTFNNCQVRKEFYDWFNSNTTKQ